LRDRPVYRLGGLVLDDAGRRALPSTMWTSSKSRRLLPQTLADAKLSGISENALHDKVNVNGSDISLGYPIGATGTMRLMTLLNEMRRRDVRYGIETICGGGGQGICMIVERS
jgi:hypothetical protein